MTRLLPYFLFTLFPLIWWISSREVSYEEKPEETTVVAPPPPPCNCTLTQGSFSAPLPFMTSNQTANSFYAYNNPDPSSSNTGLEMSETFLVMLYEDTNTGNTSLIFILDIANDATGGELDVTFNCLPDTAVVTLTDDGGELIGTPPNIIGDFVWDPCCTDGGVMGGIGCGNTFTINPDAISGINFFSLVYGTPTNPTYINMPDINCPITIDCGGTSCCTDAFEFSAVTQDASCDAATDGSIDLNTDCAYMPSFQWSTGATSEDLSDLEPGSYSVTITDGNGCSETANYLIQATAPSPVPTITGPTEFCTGEFITLSVPGSYTSYQWSTGDNSSAIITNQPGTYSVTVTNTGGCTGTASIDVTENPVPVPDITGPTELCFGEEITLDAGGGFVTYQWSTGDNTETISVDQVGGYSVTVTNSFGCFGVDFLVVQPLPSPTPMITGPDAICDGQSITLDAGAGYDSYNWSTGDDTQQITIDQGGIYAVTVTNEFNCEAIALQNVSQGPADTTLLFQSSCSPLDTGTFVQQYTNQFGCDSLEVLTVTLDPSDTTLVNGASCNPLDTGLFVQTLSNQFGCDSLILETISLLPSDSITIFATSCLPQDTGTVVTPLQNQFGCDSILTTITTLVEADTTFQSDTTCDPQQAGTFEELFTGSQGCDSLVITDVQLLPSDTVMLAAETCDPMEVGMTENVLVNQFGCDSLVITEITLFAPDSTFIDTTTCDPQQAGTFEDILTTSDGCDSIVITNVALLPSDTIFLNAESCDPNEEGTTEELLSNQFGCDSLIVTTTTLLPSDTTEIDQTSCDPNQAGTEEILLMNTFGCDSLVIINTSFSAVDTTDIQLFDCDPMQTGVEEEIFTNQLGCDSLVITTTSLLPSDTTFLAAESCNPNDVGTTEVLLSNQFGCDSLIVTVTSLLPSDTTFLSAESCEPNDVGTTEVLLSNQFGCDSLIVTTTSLLPSDTTFLSAESCDPDDVGTTETLLSNQFGCDSLIVTTTSLLPSDTTFLSAESCDPNNVGTTEVLLSNQFGCDSLIVITTTLLPSDTTFLSAESCDPNDVGTTETLLNNQFGCDSLVVTTTSLLPSDTTFLTAESCDPNDVGTTEVLLSNQFGCDSLIVTTTALLPSDTTFLFFGSCSVLDTGTVVTVLSNQFGCDSTIIAQTDLLPPAECQLLVEVSSDTIGCNESTGQLVVAILDGQSPYAYNWEETGGNTGSGVIPATNVPTTITDLPPGQYTLTITDPGGFMALVSGEIYQAEEIAWQLQTESDYNGFPLSCPGATDGSAAISVVSGGIPPYSYSWSNGNTTPQATGLGVGWTSVTVTGAEGCTAVDSVFLSPPDSLLFELFIDDPDCFADGTGAISVENTTGGVPPYEYALDAGPWQEEPFFGPLSSGNFLVEVQDANGCIAGNFAFLNSITYPQVSLGPDTTLQLGDSVQLQPVFSLPYELLDSLYWTGVDCGECAQVTVMPLVSSSYSVTIIDSLGCRGTDEMSVQVDRSLRVYAPNIFSPDQDGINDRFTIYGGRELVRIREFRIFSRWGEPVFLGIDLPPNEPALGWDGSFRGEPQSQGVYAWFAVLEFLDGRLETIKGDVMLMR